MHVLIVDDERNFSEILINELPGAWGKRAVESVAEARQALGEDTFDVVILDLRLPDGSGLELLGDLKSQANPPEVFVLTGHGTIADAVEAMRLGVTDFITKPAGLERLESLIRAAAGRRGIETELTVPVETFDLLPPNLRRLAAQVAPLADTDLPLLIQGESGVGKDWFARFLHAASPRSQRPFVAINCAAIPEALFESEFFGFERGAFTGAEKSKAGYLEAADRGTIFLDEVGDLSAAAQAKLLRFLDSGEYYRVGSARPLHADVRVLSATNADLGERIVARTFRSDLYFRLNGFRIVIPPLRERPEDVLHFAREKVTQAGKRLTPAAEARLLGWGWPGNVRELMLALQRAIAFAGRHHEVAEAHLSLALSGRAGWEAPAPTGADPSSDALELETVIEAHILRVLRMVEGNKAKAAELLGIDPKTLYRRLKAMRERGLLPDE